jgi:hypothetical protein
MRLKWVNLFVFIFMFVIQTSCTTQSHIKSDIPLPKIKPDQYAKLISNNTKKDSKYDGFQNLYEVSATLLSTEIKLAQLDRIRFYQSWDPIQVSEERERYLQRMSSESEFFLSYFSPQKDLRKLHSGKTPWKIYLEVNGKRYEGRIKKYLNNKAQVNTLFPHHSRWSKAYLAVFKVPTEAIENSSNKFIFTSSAGKSIFEY